MNTRITPAFFRRWSIALAGLTVLALCFTPLLARPPGGGTPSIRPSRPGGSFNWQGLLEGMARPTPTHPSRPYRPSTPSFTPGGTVLPPSSTQRYLPAPTVVPSITPPPNVLPPSFTTSTSTPPKLAKLLPPKQLPPLTGRVWEVSIRESRCYAHQLKELAEKTLTAAIDAFVKGGGDLKLIQPQIDPVRQMLGRNASWREIEPEMKAFFEKHHALFSDQVADQFQLVLSLLLVRDGFVVVGNAAPRGRGVACAALTGIPTGLLWILYDPTLPPGSGLIVNDWILVCGTGGTGELWLERTTAADGLGLPIAAGEPLPDINAQEAQSFQESIVLGSDPAAGADVNYVLNGQHSYTLKPGFRQKLPANQSWGVEFDQGGGQGTARYTLTKGWYEFRFVGGKWTLAKLNFDVTIDNRDGTQDFQYLADNRVVTVKPGEVQTHHSPEPITVEFDRGAGPEEPARKSLNKNGTYKIAVDTDLNTWDLFAGEPVPDKKEKG